MDPAPPPNGEASDVTTLLMFMRRTGKLQTLKAGKDLFREKEPCRGAYFVEDGELELTISNGKKVTLGVACLGQLLAIASVIQDSEHQFTATAITDCSVLFVESEGMRGFLRQHAETCLHMVQGLGAEVLDLSTNMIRPLRLQPRYPKSH